LILGGSHTYNGVNPSYFSQNAFNASHGSQSWKFDYEIFKKYKDDFNNLKIIILNVSVRSLWYKMENSEEPWRKAKYVIYYKIGSNTFSLRENTEFFSSKFFTNIERLFKNYCIERIDLKLKYGLGYAKHIGTSSLQAIHGRHVINIISSKKNVMIFEENLEILNLFSEFCNQHNVKLIFLTTPAYHTYRENLPPEQINKMIETINTFVEKHPNSYYLNWFENSDFVADDFYNADHLNDIGAEKLSKKLANYIDSLELYQSLY